MIFSSNSLAIQKQGQSLPHADIVQRRLAGVKCKSLKALRGIVVNLPLLNESSLDVVEIRFFCPLPGDD